MIFFTDFFSVDEDQLRAFGGFNISLINDLPLFIDPFLLFGSEKEEYKALHGSILEYLSFLKQKSEAGKVTEAQIKSWYVFKEIKQNWLGFSIRGNSGSGLGMEFGRAMSRNMPIVFKDLKDENLTDSTHLEKAALFQIGVGKDNISDFTCNLIKSYLLQYTEDFAKQYLNESQVKKINVDKVYFDYRLERWMPKEFTLPVFKSDYILLTPRDLLTKDDSWINQNDLRGDFFGICSAIPNDQLRSEINNYYAQNLPAPRFTADNRQKAYTKEEVTKAIDETLKQFPDIIDYYIGKKEKSVVKAKQEAKKKVEDVEILFQDNVSQLTATLASSTDFYKATSTNAKQEALQRINFLKDVIENKDGYRLFYVNGEPLRRESDLQVIYRLTWYSSPYDVNREVNNGRGPVDYIISHGSADKSLVEFKLASNAKLKMNLENQVKVYEKASSTNKSLKVIMYFKPEELNKVQTILQELNLSDDEDIILIDACDNKPSASNVKCNSQDLI